MRLSPLAGVFWNITPDMEEGLLHIFLNESRKIIYAALLFYIITKKWHLKECAEIFHFHCNSILPFKYIQTTNLLFINENPDQLLHFNSNVKWKSLLLRASNASKPTGNTRVVIIWLRFGFPKCFPKCVLLTDHSLALRRWAQVETNRSGKMWGKGRERKWWKTGEDYRSVCMLLLY